MCKFTPWLGLCHLRLAVDDNSDTRLTLVAVWADSVECFELEIHVHTTIHGQQMIWAEDVLPAEEWLAKHPDRKDAQRLAAKVSEKHPVEIGAFGAGATGMVADDTPDGEAEGYLHIEEIEGVEPLEAQFGVHPPKTVPDALYEPLFGQPESSTAEVAQHGGADKVPPLNTYAILDAAKVVNFVEMLEASGLEHRCLFKGDAAEEMRDVAPYVVRLEEGNDFTRNLFSKDPAQEVLWFMWDKEPGIYIRSRGSLEDMWRHFRKFTKVQDEDGKWFYFRFWEGKEIANVFKALEGKNCGVAGLWYPKDLPPIDAMIAPSKRTTFCIRLPSKGIEEEPSGPFILTRHDQGLLGQAKSESFYKSFARKLFDASPKHCCWLGIKSSVPIENMMAVLSKELAFYGFLHRNEIAKISAMACFFGTYFLRDARVLPVSRMYLVESPKPQIVRAVRFEEAFKKQGLANIVMANSTLKVVAQILPQVATSKPDVLQQVARLNSEILPANARKEFLQQCQAQWAKWGVSSEAKAVAHALCALVFTPYFLDDPLHETLHNIFLSMDDDSAIVALDVEFQRRLNCKR